jgi:hypothetical protein
LQKLRRDIAKLLHLLNCKPCIASMIHLANDDHIASGTRNITNSTARRRPTRPHLPIPETRPQSPDSSSSGSSSSNRQSIFSSSQSQSGDDTSPITPISRPRFPTPLSEETEYRMVSEIVSDTRRSPSSIREFLPVTVSFEPFFTESINFETDIHQTPTSLPDRNRSSRLEPTPINDTPVPALLVREDADGTITAGTVEGLIELLINDSPAFLNDIRNRMKYRDAFLMSYVAFTTADTVFKFLVRRFREVAIFGAQRRGILRYK